MKKITRFLILLGLSLFVLYISIDLGGDFVSYFSPPSNLIATASRVTPTQFSITGTNSLSPVSAMKTKTPTKSILEILNDEITSNLMDCCPASQLMDPGVQIIESELMVFVDLDRFDILNFIAAIGVIHGSVGNVEPDVDTVIIQDVSGQQIIVSLLYILDYQNDIITYDEYRDSWLVINP